MAPVTEEMLGCHIFVMKRTCNKILKRFLQMIKKKILNPKKITEMKVNTNTII